MELLKSAFVPTGTTSQIPAGFRSPARAGRILSARTTSPRTRSGALARSAPSPACLSVACLDTNDVAPQVSLSTSAVTLGHDEGNTTTERYGYMTDWSVDFGSGFGNDCNKTLSPQCVTQGFHLLSTPRRQYISDCCGADGTSLVSILRSGNFGEACRSLREMIAGPLRRAKGGPWRSCTAENQDPIAPNACLAQCFHFVPDVRVLHLHTTAGVKAMRRGPIDSALGPDYNVTQVDDKAFAYGRYNVCVCEPSKWSGRGNCPSASPTDEDAYVTQAVTSLCLNALGAAAKGSVGSTRANYWQNVCQRCASST